MLNKTFYRSIVPLIVMICMALLALSMFVVLRSESPIEPPVQDLRIDAQDLQINARDLEIDGWIEVPDTLVIGTGHYQIISPGQYIIIDTRLNTVTMTAPIQLWRVNEGLEINEDTLIISDDVSTMIDTDTTISSIDMSLNAIAMTITVPIELWRITEGE